MKSAALDLHLEAKKGSQAPTPKPEWWDMGAEDFRSYVETPTNLTKFNDWVAENDVALTERAPGRLLQYKNASGSVNAKPYTKSLATTVQATPYTFKDKGPAYKLSATKEMVRHEISRLDTRTAASC